MQNGQPISPVVVYAIGAGPLADPVAQAAVRECLDAAAVVTVREPSARRVLEDAGVRRAIRVTADPALLLRPEPLKGDLLPPELRLTKGSLVGMSVREPGVAAPDLKEDVYHQLLANAADYIVDRFGAEVVFVPMLTAGRCISGTHEALSSYRVMPVAMAVGQAAGGCAALAARAGATPRALAVTDVQRELLRQGADLRGVVPA